MANFSTVVTVASETYDITSTVKLPFTPKKLVVQNFNPNDPQAIAYVSLDGQTDAVAISSFPFGPAAFYKFEWTTGNQIWIRTDGGNPAIIQVIAEAP